MPTGDYIVLGALVVFVVIGLGYIFGKAQGVGFMTVVSNIVKEKKRKDK